MLTLHCVFFPVCCLYRCCFLWPRVLSLYLADFFFFLSCMSWLFCRVVALYYACSLVLVMFLFFFLAYCSCSRVLHMFTLLFVSYTRSWGPVAFFICVMFVIYIFFHSPSFCCMYLLSVSMFFCIGQFPTIFFLFPASGAAKWYNKKEEKEAR